MTPDLRQRMIAAAERGLAYRRDRIMGWRCTLFTLRQCLGFDDDWHAYFECDRHGHHPLTAKWVGPYELGNVPVPVAVEVDPGAPDVAVLDGVLTMLAADGGQEVDR